MSINLGNTSSYLSSVVVSTVVDTSLENGSRSMTTSQSSSLDYKMIVLAGISLFALGVFFYKIPHLLTGSRDESLELNRERVPNYDSCSLDIETVPLKSIEEKVQEIPESTSRPYESCVVDKDYNFALWSVIEEKSDKKMIVSHRDKIFSGYHSIGEQYGWSDVGGSISLALPLLRYSVKSFFSKNVLKYQENSAIVKSTVLSLFYSDEYFNHLALFKPHAYWNKLNSSCEDHCFYKLVGSINKELFNQETARYFQIISTTETTTGNCFPFSVLVFPSKTALDIREQTLKMSSVLNAENAVRTFAPSQIPQANQARCLLNQKDDLHLSAQEVRLLESLVFLENRNLPGQLVGAKNCWMIQAKRLFLATLFLEFANQQEEMSMTLAWKKAEKIFNSWEESTSEWLDEVLLTQLDCRLRNIYQTHFPKR